MKWTGVKVFVTGADGFIGSHLTERLVMLGAKVTALSYYNSFNRNGWLDSFGKEIKDQIEIVPGDIRDPYIVQKAMKAKDMVFHLAALIAIPYSYNAPASYVETNVIGTLNVLNAVRENQVRRMVHTSTSEVYGTAQYVPIDEDHPLNAQSPYAATKTGADQLALSFFRSFRTPVSVIRPFNTYGPRQSARAIIPATVIQLLAGKRAIRLGNLKPTRDLTFVKDTVSGFIKAAESDRSVGEVINLGTNTDVSMEALVKKIIRIMNVKATVVQDKARLRPENSEVYRLKSDNSKARRLLDWKPMTKLDDGLRETIGWFSDKDNLLLYKPDEYNI